MFTRFGRLNPEMSSGDSVLFSNIKGLIAEIISYQGKKEDRISKWRTAARNGKLGVKFRIPEYDPETWMKEGSEMNSGEDSKIALGFNLYRFYQAASLHRQYLLRELLPEHKLIVA
jgi:hypothetical protein